MRNRKLTSTRLVAYTVIVAVTLLLALNFYPRDLKGVAGLREVTPDHIAQMQLSMAVFEEPGSSGVLPRAELIASNEVITDEDFFIDVLELLSGHTMRRRLLSRGVDYRRTDFTKPSIVLISVSLDSNKTVFIDVSNDPRFVAIWSDDSPYTRYRLYGEGINTDKLHRSVLKLLESN